MNSIGKNLLGMMQANLKKKKEEEKVEKKYEGFDLHSLMASKVQLTTNKIE